MDRQRLINLLAAIAAITVFGFALGLMFPLLSLIMEKNGLSNDVIGYNAAIGTLGILAAGFFMPRLVRTWGQKATAIAAAFLVAVIILAYPFLAIFWWWFGLRLLHGFAVSVLFATSEAWVVKFSEGRWRSRILALYASVLALSFGGGPAIISFTGIDSIAPFAIGAAVLLAATIPIFFLRDPDPAKSKTDGALSALAFAPKAPLLLAAVCLFATIDAACLNFLPVYGVKKGLDRETAALCLTAFVFGNIALQFPIGWLADHMNKRTVMAGCGLVTAIAIALIPISFGTPLMWLLLLITGAASAGIYTVSLAQLGEQFSGGDLVAGTAAFSTMWGTGALFGSLIAGWSMQGFGPDGLPYTMSAIFFLFILSLYLRRSFKPA
jgi:MFS family permease